MNETKRSIAEFCAKHGVECYPTPLWQKVGIAENVKSGTLPINGLRHLPSGDTSGWYIWGGGEIPLEDDHFFVPLHIEHLDEWCPGLIKFITLPPGWRFQVAPDYEDVWFDPSLLTE